MSAVRKPTSAERLDRIEVLLERLAEEEAKTAEILAAILRAAISTQCGCTEAFRPDGRKPRGGHLRSVE